VEVFNPASTRDSWREKVPPKRYNNLPDYITFPPRKLYNHHKNLKSHGNEPSGSIEGRKVTDYLKEYFSRRIPLHGASK
jgi:hypothetical protein